MNQSDNDSFGDDDDFDLNEVLNNVIPTQKSQKTSHVNKDDTRIAKSTNNQTSKQPEDIYLIKGENAVLKNKITKLAQDQQIESQKLCSEYDKKLKEKDEYIKALNEKIGQIYSEKEFLVSENKSLNQAQSRKRKIRCLEVDDSLSDTSNLTSSLHENQQNSQNEQQKQQDIEIKKAVNKPEIKVLIMNQATIFQDEKTLFIEAISNYIIPGMEQPALYYLETISTPIDYQNRDFSIRYRHDSFKAAILRYLINYQDKNRLDHLLEAFIEELLTYTQYTVKNELSIPYIIALTNFSLNYRPKAINENVISNAMNTLIDLAKKYQYIFKSEFDYLLLPNSDNQFLFYTPNDSLIDYAYSDKTIHDKILEIFTVIFTMDTITTLSKIAQFNKFSFKDKSDALGILWKSLPETLLINSFLSVKAPIRFIYNTVEILLNSIDDDDKFGYENLRNRSVLEVKMADTSSIKILEKIMQFLTTLTPDQIKFEVYGLNHLIGSNKHLELLKLLTTSRNKRSNHASTNSLDTYEKVLSNCQSGKMFNKEKEAFTLKVKVLILDLFESIYSSLIMIKFPVTLSVKLLKQLVELVGEQQEMVMRSPRSANIGVRVEIICKCVEIIHYLISQENIVKLSDIPNLTLRELIIVLVKISARNMNNLTIDLITKLRNEEKYDKIMFNGELEKEELDKFSIWNRIMFNDTTCIDDRISVETNLCNGIELNYPDETIDLARDIIGLSVTGDESEQLHQGVNYEDRSTTNEYDFDMDI